MLEVIAHLPSPTTAAVDDARALVWVAHADGVIASVALDGTVTQAQTLATAASGLAVRGDVLVATTAGGELLTIDPADPGVPAAPVVDTTAVFGQVALSDTGVTAAAVTTPARLRRPLPGLRLAGSISVVRLPGGGIRTIDAPGVTGVARHGRSTYVARNATIFGQGTVAQLRGSALHPLATGLPRAGRLGLSADGGTLFVAHPGAGRLSAVHPADGTVQTVPVATIPGTILEAHGLADGRIAVLTTQALALIDTLADLHRDPTIDPVAEPVFVGSWVRLGFDLGTSGLSPADIRFEVPDGPDAGFVSYARENGGDLVPLLVAGGATGTHAVTMVETAGGTVVAQTDFEVTDHWTHEDVGPAGFSATTSSFDGSTGWGGGPGTPQNMSTHPHTGTWRSMVLMVDTTDGRWPADPALATNRTEIMQHVTDGFATGGTSRSARQYYEDNSNFAAPSTGLTLGVHGSATFGPVNLPGGWGDYFAQKKNSAGAVTDQRWSSKGTTVQTIISRAISDGVATKADFFACDVLIIVPFSPDSTGGPPARFVWPHANADIEFLCGTNASTDKRRLGFAFAPLDFAAHDGRHMHATLSHELGHTLGLPDLYSFPEYSDDIDGRLTHDWDMMAGSRNRMPHYTVSNKMRMGWIDPAHLRLYNFQGSSAALQDVTLHAAELGAPPAGRFRAIEIRLGDGWNYYVEYRAEQPGLSSDDLVTDRRVVITDVTSDTFSTPAARPPIVFVRSDLDGDGPLLGTAADLEEKDPGTQMDLKVEVVSTAVDNAVVRISYGANGKPEPGIRPWDGGPTWQSTDIEVRNDKTAADPGKYFNTPWLGHDNTVVAKIRNAGDLLAKGVVVDFFVTEFSTGDGPWMSLPSVTKDIGPGVTEEFATKWNPDAANGKHYCIIVRIRLYQDPGNLAIVDQNIYNNEARSNYTKFVSASASPSSRVGADVLLANPFAGSALVFADVKKTHPQHRVFVDHQWVRIDGKAQAPVMVWDEALWGHPEWKTTTDDDPRHERGPSYLWEVPNHVSVTGWAERPFEADCGARTLTGGVGMRVDAGRETHIEMRTVKENYVVGRVLYVDDGSGVTSGGVALIEVAAGPGKSFTLAVDVGEQGQFGRDFDNPFGAGTAWIEVHYLGSYGAAPSETGALPLEP